MWLITNFGFFSVVEKLDQKGTGELTVRARKREDLEALKTMYLPQLGEIIDHGGTDYAYRAVASREGVAHAFAQAIRDLDYSNFKDSVAKKQGPDRAHLYHQLWDVLMKLQQSPASPAAKSAKPPLNAKVGDPMRTEEPVHLLPGPADANLPPRVSCGGVIVDSRGRVLLRQPDREYDGYVWTFPKGRRDVGESLEAAALREVLEECGVKAKIERRIPGVFRGGTGLNVYFVMSIVEDTGTFDRTETQDIRWATESEARGLIGQTRNELGRRRDLAVLQAAIHS